MGYGDDLLVTALAAIEKKKYPERQIVIGNINKRNAFHSVIYDNNPNISNFSWCISFFFRRKFAVPVCIQSKERGSVTQLLQHPEMSVAV